MTPPSPPPTFSSPSKRIPNLFCCPDALRIVLAFLHFLACCLHFPSRNAPPPPPRILHRAPSSSEAILRCGVAAKLAKAGKQKKLDKKLKKFLNGE